MNTSPYAIELKDLRKSYGEGEILKGITLNIEKKQIYGILGPNGAGKTTLLNILSTLLSYDSGKVSVLGMDPKKERESIAQKTNLCSGGTRFIYTFTPKEILRYYGLLYGITKSFLDKKIDELIHDLKINRFQDQRFFELSTGMKQKVALAKSLINEPELLFLDEMTIGLDVDVAKDIRDYIRALPKTKSTTIILTSHNLFEVEELCEKVAIIKDGQIIAEGKIDDIKKEIEFQNTLTIALYSIKSDLSFLKKMRGVKKVSLSDSELTVKTSESPEIAEKIISEFKKRKIKIKGLEIRKASLEEVFLKITNR